MSREAAQLLYTSIVAEAGVPTAGGDFEAVANGVLDRLGKLSSVLTPQLEAARARGDTGLAHALTGVLRRINLLLISVGQELVQYLDDAPDIAAAEAQIAGINARLEAEAEGTAKTQATLARTGDVLDKLAKLAGLLQKSEDEA